MKKLIFIFCILFSIQLSAQSGWEIAAGGGVSSCIYKETSPLKESYFEPKMRPSYYVGLGYLIQNKKFSEFRYLIQARMEAKGMNVHWEPTPDFPGTPMDYKQPLYYASLRAEFQYEFVKGIYGGVGIESGYMFSKYVDDLKVIFGNHRYDLAGVISLGYDTGVVRFHIDYSRSLTPMGSYDAAPGAKFPIKFFYYPYFIHFGVGVRIYK